MNQANACCVRWAAHVGPRQVILPEASPAAVKLALESGMIDVPLYRRV